MIFCIFCWYEHTHVVLRAVCDTRGDHLFSTGSKSNLHPAISMVFAPSCAFKFFWQLWVNDNLFQSFVNDSVFMNDTDTYRQAHKQTQFFNPTKVKPLFKKNTTQKMGTTPFLTPFSK